MRELYTCFIIIASFLEYELCRVYNNALIVNSMIMANSKKLLSLTDNKKEKPFFKIARKNFLTK